MKPKPILTKSDFNVIDTLLTNYSNSLRNKETELLEGELKRASVVEDEQIEKDIVRLNSHVTLIEESINKEMHFTLTMPQMANIAEKKLSVISPIGVALIGFKEGMTIDWNLPSGPKRIKILKVENSA